MRKVLSLIRVSSPGQADIEKDGIPRQKRQITEHCERFGLKVVQEYRLDGISGRKVQFNVKVKAMLRRLMDSDIAGIVVARMDRFFRPEFVDGYEIFKTFRQHNKLLFCDLGGLNLTDGQDQMKLQLWGMVASQELRNIRERTKEGKAKSREKADSAPDPLPVGVTYSKETRLFSYEPVAHCERVKKAFDLVLSGESLSSVVRTLKFPSQPGLKGILRNEWWIGHKTHRQIREYRDETDTNGKKVNLTKPLVVVTNLAAKPLVSPVTFQRVQLILDQKLSTWRQNTTHKNESLGSSLLYCQCGKRMYFKKGSPYGPGKIRKKDYYVCSSKENGSKGSTCKNLPVRELDSLIATTAAQYFTNPQYITAAIERDSTGRNQAEMEAEVKRLEAHSRKLESKIEKAAALSLDADTGKIYASQVIRLAQELRDTESSLAKAKSELQETRSRMDVALVAAQLRLKYFNFANPAAWTAEEQKKILTDTVERITLRPSTDGPWGSLEFVLKGGLMLDRLSAKDISLGYLDALLEVATALSRHSETIDTVIESITGEARNDTRKAVAGKREEITQKIAQARKMMEGSQGQDMLEAIYDFLAGKDSKSESQSSPASLFGDFNISVLVARPSRKRQQRLLAAAG